MNKYLKRLAAFALIMVMLAGSTFGISAAAAPRLKLNSTTLTIEAGKTFQLKTNAPVGAQIRFISSNINAASVNPSTGLITAHRAGKAVIKAAVKHKGEIYTANCNVKVNPGAQTGEITYDEYVIRTYALVTDEPKFPVIAKIDKEDVINYYGLYENFDEYSGRLSGKTITSIEERDNYYDSVKGVDIDDFGNPYFALKRTLDKFDGEFFKDRIFVTDTWSGSSSNTPNFKYLELDGGKLRICVETPNPSVITDDHNTVLCFILIDRKFYRGEDIGIRGYSRYDFYVEQDYNEETEKIIYVNDYGTPLDWVTDEWYAEYDYLRRMRRKYYEDWAEFF